MKELNKDIHRIRNVIARHGDKTAEQMITAMAELHMSSKLREEWKLHLDGIKDIPPTDKLLNFLDTRERILVTSEREKQREVKTHHTSSHPSKGQSHNHRFGKQSVALHGIVSSPSAKEAVILCISAQTSEPWTSQLAIALYSHDEHATTALGLTMLSGNAPVASPAKNVEVDTTPYSTGPIHHLQRIPTQLRDQQTLSPRMTLQSHL